jgi:hypothetical protein
MTFSNVGSENGTLTVYLAKDGTIMCTRGCFTGTAIDFMAAVRQEHGNGPIAQEYALMIQVAELRLQRNQAREAKSEVVGLTETACGAK